MLAHGLLPDLLLTYVLYGCAQLEDGKKEAERLRSQFEAERKRRWRLLEEKGDIEAVVRELYGWDESDPGFAALQMTTPGVGGAGGPARKGIALLSAETPSGDATDAVPDKTTVPIPQGADVNVWVMKYRQSVAMMQLAKERSTMAVVYRDSVVGDITRLQSSNMDITTEALTSAKSVLEQTEAKLGMLKSEVNAVIGKRNASNEEVAKLKELVQGALAAVTAPPVQQGKAEAATPVVVNTAAVPAPSPGAESNKTPLSPTAPLGPPPAAGARPTRQSTAKSKGISLTAPEDEEDVVLPLGKAGSGKKVVLLSDDSDVRPDSALTTSSAPISVGEPAAAAAPSPDTPVAVPLTAQELAEAAEAKKLETEALQLLLRVIERHAAALIKQGEEAIRVNDISGAIPVLVKIVQAESQRPVPDAAGPVPEECTDVALTTLTAALTAIASQSADSKKKGTAAAATSTKSALLWDFRLNCCLSVACPDVCGVSLQRLCVHCKLKCWSWLRGAWTCCARGFPRTCQRLQRRCLRSARQAPRKWPSWRTKCQRCG